ncbi:MAG TPA: hypothetical protein VIG06_06140, partial [Kofleriaceae bacterium]
ADGVGDDDVTVARPGPSRVALDVAGDGDGVVRKPSGRRDAVTVPMQAGVARLDTPSDPPRTTRPAPERTAAAPPAPEPVPHPIEPAPTEPLRRPVRWRASPPWLPALALLFGGLCVLAALLYYIYFL